MRSLLLSQNFPFYQTPSRTKKQKLGYFHQFLLQEDLHSVKEALQKEIRSAVDTPFSVVFKGLQFGSSPLAVTLKLGLPQLVIRKDEHSNHVIYAYREKVSGQKIIIFCHFLNRQLLFIQTCYPSATQMGKENILNILEEKYKCFLPHHFTEACITNKQGERIVVLNDVYLSLLYISGDKALHKELQTILDSESRVQKTNLRKIQLSLNS